MSQINTGAMAAPEKPEDVRARLFFAVTMVGGPAQAQRRTVRLGSFQRMVATVLRDGANASELQRQGVLSAQEAELVKELHRKLSALRDSRDDFLAESISEPREFLWSHALEDEEWSAVRHLARRCFTLMRPPSYDPRI